MTRISGLASGMDIDTLVSSMMQAARAPLDTITQKKTFTEWQRDDYRDINKSLLELDTLIFDGIGKQSSYIKKTVNVSDPNAISVKNISSTSDFSGTVNVETLASAATSVGTIAKMDPTAKLTTKGTFTIEAKGTDGKVAAVPITYDETDTLNSVIEKINSKSNVTAFYDEATGQISFTAKQTGSNNQIKITGDMFGNATFKNQDGGNAKLTYNGLEIERSSNTFQINGVEITVKQKTEGPVTFSSTADVDAVMDTVVKFVAKYNELVTKIKGKTDETKYRAYQPLTAAQRKEMDESDIKLWDEKAKSGTLRNDSTLNGVLTKMRSSLYGKVDGTSTFSQLSQIGITTTKNYNEGGKLVINEEELRKAISENPNAIYELFQKEGTTTENQGLARRLRADLKTAMADITTKAGKASAVNNTFTIGKILDSYDKKISSFETKLTALETRYYKQFTAMETAINKANSQSSSLSSYFS
ncbi:flagellar hook-associated protein 2 [Peribacillus psychrosaccharolyticus]|uniref:flagellar hook-associated protein 2 n=1 Tax=Peribacillus psychrosaccharolyticus TaxID=1407 RepID=UPI003D28F5FA